METIYKIFQSNGTDFYHACIHSKVYGRGGNLIILLPDNFEKIKASTIPQAYILKDEGQKSSKRAC
ncbi:MAG: hypothetical protein H5T50_06615 [Nitrososphaeria archaeon]|nr:hypothetical protein [Nitrososphaeria archaeon]